MATYTDTDVPHTPQSFSDYPSGMSPDSFSERSLSPEQNTFSASSPKTPSSTSQESEAKPVKKRKSWGQQLPTPTTNLPPRKRAKTAEEKEQRRVERVLRNRAAAQKSREIKKQQLEAIEQDRDALKLKLQEYEELNRKLREEIQMIKEHHRTCQPGSSSTHLPPSPAPSHIKEEPGLLSPQSDHDDIDLGLPVLDYFPPSKSEDTHQSLNIDPQQLQSTDEVTEHIHFDIQTPFDSMSSPSMTQQPAALLCDQPCLLGKRMILSYALTCWIANWSLTMSSHRKLPSTLHSSPFSLNSLRTCRLTSPT